MMNKSKKEKEKKKDRRLPDYIIGHSSKSSGWRCSHEVLFSA